MSDFLATVEDERRRLDCFELIGIMRRVTNAEPTMWGPSIVGFGHCHYRYESGREGDWFLVGFSPRKRELSLYLLAGVERFPDLAARLGKFKTGKSCLYIKRLEDVDQEVLAALIARSVEHTRAAYPSSQTD